MKRLFFFLLTAAVACGMCVVDAAHAQTPYAGEHMREIKVLSADEIAAYRKGEGMGLAKAAELNHYPGPKHALQMDELRLTPAQRSQIEEQYAEMLKKAVELGKRIIEQEKALDTLFSDQKADARSTREILRAIGALQADLRFVHLNAHLETKAVLSEEQVARYDAVRGYGEHDGEHDHSKMNH